MSDKKEPKNKGLGKSDIALWREMTSDVSPLPEQGYQEGHEDDAPSVDKMVARETVIIKNPEKSRGVSASAVGLDRRTDERLRRGQMAIDATLDLHGLNQQDAYVALGDFIRSGYAQGRRCVLVITGKGRNAPGVLRQKVPEWLAEQALAAVVLQTHPARPQHGGGGALYVLLRRQR